MVDTIGISSVHGRVQHSPASHTIRGNRTTHCAAHTAAHPHEPEGKYEMTTGTPQAATTDPATMIVGATGNAGEELIGDHYDETVDMTWDHLGDRVQQDLYDVRNDHMLPATAEFQVTPDTCGTIPVLRITITA
jgi:hypothetical protein